MRSNTYVKSKSERNWVGEWERAIRRLIIWTYRNYSTVFDMQNVVVCDAAIGGCPRKA